MKLPIYLDHHSTTPCDSRVVRAMLPFFTDQFGNPAATVHAFGREVERVVAQSRSAVAEFLGAEASEIIFTSGATEASNIAILGVARAYREKGNHIITGPTEHKSVLETVKSLEGEGFRITVLPVDRYGRVDPQDLSRSIEERTILVSLMAANNEVGTLHPFEEIGRRTRAKGVLFHCDAAQALGKVPVDVEKASIDLLSLSGHKMYGPKGVGALYIRKRNPRVRITPILFGASHERGLRPGTHNVPGIVGLAEACKIATQEMTAEEMRLSTLRDRLQNRILNDLDGVVVNGHPTERLPHNLNLSFEGVPPEQLLQSFSDIAISSGSSCSSATRMASFVLRAMGVSEDMALSSIRIGLGRSNTEDEVDLAADTIVNTVKRLRKSFAGSVGG